MSLRFSEKEEQYFPMTRQVIPDGLAWYTGDNQHENVPLL